MNWLPLLIAIGGSLLSAFAGRKTKEETYGTSGLHPEGEATEYPGGYFTFESLTPEQKQIMSQLTQVLSQGLGQPSIFGQPSPYQSQQGGAGGQMGQIGSMLPTLLGTGGGSSCSKRR